MDGNDKKAIEDLFVRLTEVERQGIARDPEAEAYIREQIGAHPGAPYYMAQTIVVQEQALQAAQMRIEALERQQDQREPEGGGFLGGLFGGGQRSSGRVPSIPRRGAGAVPPQNSAFGGRGSGGGFLAGAAQTAMGVAGGLLLGNMIAGAFAGDEAMAAEDAAADEVPADEAPADDFGGDDMGGDFGDMEF